MALVDRLDPARLASSLDHVQGQTVVLTGRIENDALSFIDANGGDGSLPLEDIRTAARNADVNLVVVKSETRRQPGGKNWLWQNRHYSRSRRRREAADLRRLPGQDSGPMTSHSPFLRGGMVSTGSCSKRCRHQAPDHSQTHSPAGWIPGGDAMAALQWPVSKPTCATNPSNRTRPSRGSRHPIIHSDRLPFAPASGLLDLDRLVVVDRNMANGGSCGVWFHHRLRSCAPHPRNGLVLVFLRLSVCPCSCATSDCNFGHS